ncbi:MAG: alpha/beta fold hydrolase [Rhodospirillaceae bacterium]|nr:alpha/beta fold hydrolase [Rhodospirillaceae bacterium]
MKNWIGAFLATTALLASAAVAEDQVIYKKGYVDGPYGQIHYHSARPADGTDDKTPLVLFHQNPKSAEEYRPLVEVVGRDRLAIAFDTPGYGESDRPDSPPDMAGIANAMADALDALGYGQGGKGKVDVFGFHTGVFIASELAIIRPDLVRGVVLSGIAYYDTETRADRLANLPTEKTLPEDGTFIMNRWYLIVINRSEGVSLERAAKIFLEDIHSLDKSWYAYNAVWTYVPEERFPLIKQPVLILQPHEMLLEKTRTAKKEALPDADMIEFPDITDDVFDTGSEEIGSALTTWLDQL